MNKNRDSFSGIVVRAPDGTELGRLSTFKLHRNKVPEIYRLGEDMEKYGVQVDKKKLDETKKGLGEKTAGVDDPNVNVPKDPDKGTEPFEKKSEDE